MKWFVIIISVMAWVTYSSEEHVNPLVLLQILIDRGFFAWIELAVITTVIVLPSYFTTKWVDRLAGKRLIKLEKLKSVFFASVFTISYCLILMALLEPIKNV